MQINFTQLQFRKFLVNTLLIIGFLCLNLNSSTAQQYVNGNLSTGATASDAASTAAPTGFTWSEIQAGNTSFGLGAPISAGLSLADDFTIAAGSWTISKLTFFAYSTGYTGATSPFTTLRIKIYNTDPSVGNPTPVFGDTLTNRLTASSSANMYRISNATPGTTRQIWKLEAAITPISLPAGTYWIEWQTGVTTGVTSNFTPPSTVVGTTTQPGNNAKQHNIWGATWTNVADAGGLEAQDFNFIIDYTSPNCTGTPVPGNTVSTLTSVCSNVSFNLSVSGSFNGAGINFQWQSSPDNSTWSDITGATNPTYSTTQSSSTWYRLSATCSGSTAFSTPVQVTQNSGSACYCTPTTSDCSLNDVITKVKFSTINNNSTCSANGYEDYTATVTAPDLTLGAQYKINVTVGNGGTEYVGAWIDFNQDGTFDASEFKNVGSGNGVVINGGNWLMPSTATVGFTRMRVRVQYNLDFTGADACADLNLGFGETEDYLVNLVAPPSCSGTPNPGNTISTLTNACPATTFDLSTSLDVNSIGITYQWQSSTDSLTWTDISGATASTFTTSLSTTSLWFRQAAFCNLSSAGYSNSVKVNLNPPSACFCTPPSTSCTLSDVITNVTFEGIDNTTTCSTAGYSNYSDSLPAAQLTSGETYPISVTVGAGGTEYVGVWIDYNQNGVFDDAEFTAIGSANGAVINSTISVPTDALAGTTKMRVRLRFVTALTGADACIGYTYGETEDYAISIVNPVPCVGTPNPGATVSTNSRACPGVEFTLSTANNINSLGMSYQWQSSADGITYTDIAGATSRTYTTTQTDTTWYRMLAVCATGNDSATSTPIRVAMNPITDCYCLPPSTNCSLNDNITNVTISNLNNTSTCGGTTGYTNYSSSVAAVNLSQSARYPMSVSVGTGGTEFVGVWIDYNQNGVFDTNEFTNLGSGTGNAVIGNIAIPATSLLGVTKMRVRVRFATALTGADACLGYTYGETEDYKVVISCGAPAFLVQPSATTTVCGRGVNLYAHAGGGVQEFQWQVKTSATSPWANVINGGEYSGATTDTLSINPVADAMNGYLFRALATNCGATGVSDSARLSVTRIPAAVTPTTAAFCRGGSTPIEISGDAAGVSTTVTFSSSALGLTIPDNGLTSGVNHTIDVSGIPAGVTITGMKVKLNATHTWVGDLVAVVKAPNNKVLSLDYVLTGTTGTNATGTSGLANTVFSSDGTAFIKTSPDTSFFTGTFKPDAYLPAREVANDAANNPVYTLTNIQSGPDGFIPDVTNFSNLYTVPNGPWTLAMYDYWADSVYSVTFPYPTPQPINTFDSWSIEITYSTAVRSYGIWSPATGLFTDSALTTPYVSGTLAHNVFAAPSASTNYSLVAQTPGCSSNPVVVPVTVYPDPYAVIKAAPYTRLYPGLTTTINTTVHASTPNVTYQWQFNGVDINGATDSAISVNIDGLGEYSVKLKDGHGCAGPTSNIVAIDDSLSTIAFVYPNPNKGAFEIRFNDKYNGVDNPLTIKIYDSKGSTVYLKSFTISKAFQAMKVDISSQPKGVYFLELKDASNTSLQTRKLMIQ